MSHLEQCWSQLEALIQQKIQDSAQTLEDLARVESQLKDAREWVEEQQPALTSALKTSPPPDLAQNFLFDHLSVCVELEARQQLLGHAVSEAQAVASRLGLSEKRGLQELVKQAQTEVEALGARVAQRRKYLSKVSSWAFAVDERSVMSSWTKPSSHLFSLMKTRNQKQTFVFISRPLQNGHSSFMVWVERCLGYSNRRGRL